MLLLGIESSCDETAAAVVRDGRDVLSNVIASQDDLHAQYGGVVPEIASRAHVERLTPVVRRALADAGVRAGDLDGVAVGSRPGLIGSLLVGVAGAKALAWALSVPIVGVDHIHAHLYAGLLDRPAPPPFPALGLVVSGGHTSLHRMASPIELERLGSTIDDAAGEAYDKCAAILQLGFPGGPRVDALAQRGDERAFDFPLSRIAPGSLDFSFSGLKTAVLYAARGVPQRKGEGTRFARAAEDLSEREKADVAASFQRAAVGSLVLKVRRALDAAGPFRSLLVGGGVSANSRLRRELEALAAERSLELRLPAMAYCLDNAAMIAGLGHALLAAGRASDLRLRAEATGAR
jgi:N6-L-threonylcarbamoyladenine synthase